MKILMSCNINLGIKSAPIVHITEVMKNLKKEGHDVILFVRGIGRYDPHIQGIKYVPTLDFPVLKLVIFDFFLCIYAIVYSLKFKPDDILWICIILLKILGVPCIVEVNGSERDELKIQKTQKYLAHIIHFNWWLNLKLSDKIVAVSEGIKKELCEEYKIPSDKIVVINNGADTELFKPMDKEKEKAELKLDKNIHYVCFVGNLAPWQGVEYLIRSAPLILREIPDTKFLIVGDGVMKEKLIEMVKELNLENDFIFTGAVDYELVPKYINVSDVCVALKAHLKSGYSTLKMYEYLACGKPVVASNEHGLGDVLEKTVTGISVNREDFGDVANAIVKLIRNKELRGNMGENGRKLVIEKYSWNATAKQIAEVCEQIIN